MTRGTTLTGLKDMKKPSDRIQQIIIENATKRAKHGLSAAVHDRHVSYAIIQYPDEQVEDPVSTE